jgi:hypothetical protein
LLIHGKLLLTENFPIDLASLEVKEVCHNAGIVLLFNSVLHQHQVYGWHEVQLQLVQAEHLGHQRWLSSPFRLPKVVDDTFKHLKHQEDL